MTGHRLVLDALPVANENYGLVISLNREWKDDT